MKKEVSISAIKDGTVIDHIPSNATFKVIDTLDLKGIRGIISAATNLKSKKMGKKGIIKISEKYLTQDEVNKIAIIAPDASVNIIENYNVKKKLQVSIPQTIHKAIKCSNPNCITNVEKIPGKFDVLKKDPVKVRCLYCERDMDKEDIVIL
ncbi:aspartate carbamoyltransferase regulatory subunit [Candidatus Woesearchaeota archaeon]|jgi:aspartate carbamoyltransferase regulatory subunit|nr:aspartate carbamoyltransferase regulatory subunit [Candidatus Woesearchaeota archaeon]|tara:strand:- start:793 stop:1245 length:453 start_codon:yes stop_codon:yes gene_type:complete